MVHEELEKKLREIWDEKDFVRGVLQFCRNDEGKEEMLWYINNFSQDPSDIVEYALAIRDDAPFEED